MKDIHTFVILAYGENDNLEDCIKSVLNQTVKTNVIVATSTNNDYIMDLASQYGLGVMVNEEKSNKGNDYNFAINTFDTGLVTIAHQDDIYDRNYVKEVLDCYQKNTNASLIITDYYAILKDKRINNNYSMLRKKRLIKPLKYPWFQDKKYFKLRTLKYGKCFCTSSVTFVKKNLETNLFPTDLCYNNDWMGFVKLAKKPSRFVYLDKKLVGYRLGEELSITGGEDIYNVNLDKEDDNININVDDIKVDDTKKVNNEALDLNINVEDTKKDNTNKDINDVANTNIGVDDIKKDNADKEINNKDTDTDIKVEDIKKDDTTKDVNVNTDTDIDIKNIKLDDTAKDINNKDPNNKNNSTERTPNETIPNENIDNREVNEQNNSDKDQENKIVYQELWPKWLVNHYYKRKGKKNNERKIK